MATKHWHFAIHSWCQPTITLAVYLGRRAAATKSRSKPEPASRCVVEAAGPEDTPTAPCGFLHFSNRCLQHPTGCTQHVELTANSRRPSDRAYLSRSRQPTQSTDHQFEVREAKYRTKILTLGIEGLTLKALQALAPLVDELLCIFTAYADEDIEVVAMEDASLGPTVLAFVDRAIGGGGQVLDDDTLFEMLQWARQVIARCPCSDGCNDCVQAIHSAKADLLKGFPNDVEVLVLKDKGRQNSQ